MELAETEVVPAGEQPSKTCEEKKEGACQHTRTRFGLFCDGVKYYYSSIVVVYFMVWVKHYYLMLLTGCSMGMNKKIWRKMNLREALRNLH